VSPRSSARLALAICGVAGVVLAFLYPDSYQQDGGHHYLFARFAWTHPELFVGVWSRPLFTFLYSVPAQFGYPAAKLFTLALCLLTADQTVRLAEKLGLPRAPLVVVLLFLQPAFLMIAADTMTEPLFALVFVVAVRLHIAGRIRTAMVVASLMILARPEGFFLGILWGVWVLADARDPRAWPRRLPATLLLLTGVVTWWLAAWFVTGDPLFIKHNWPANWGVSSAWYGVGPIWTYVARLPEIAGPLLGPAFLTGMALLVVQRRLVVVTSPILVLFVVHSMLRTFGWFGSAGYPRYFVCVSPAIAIVTLMGWNAISDWIGRVRPAWRRPAGAVVLAASTIVCVFYVDLAGFYGRDARAVREMHEWFRDHPRPISRLVWSQAYMAIVFDRDPWEKPVLSSDRAASLATLRASPPGTLVFWDGETGPAWHGLSANDIESAGYERLRSQSYRLDGWLRGSRWLATWTLRSQEMHLFYKHHKER
jgi:hypothetical protein